MGTLWIIAAAAATVAVAIALFELVLWMAAREKTRAPVLDYDEAHAERADEREPAGVR